ncbi:MAG: hypothetical protein ACK452_12495 [Bacteroidota bacterium]|jgi:hypothetical protein
MNLTETEIKPLTEVEIDTETKTRIKEESREERQVTVHCTFNCPPGEPQLIRVWSSTFLVDKSSSHRSSLLHAENITLFPNWTPVFGGSSFVFTLLFSALPSTCESFDLYEEIPQSGGFFVANIKRNELDVYRVVIE